MDEVEKPVEPTTYSFTHLDDELARVAYTSFIARLAKSRLVKPPEGTLPPGTWEDQHPEIKQCWRDAIKSVRIELAAKVLAPE